MSFKRLSGNTGVRALGVGLRDPLVKFGKNYNCVELPAVVLMETKNTTLYKPAVDLVLKQTVDIVIHPMLLQYQVRFPYRLEPGEERYLCFEVSKEAEVLELPWSFRIYVPDTSGRFLNDY